ncbi:MAG: hypothetical protein NXH83_08960 [Rhodobacteraceae bacterium]|nr:hypothetical protein [Paracoccaceae bacterium]
MTLLAFCRAHAAWVLFDGKSGSGAVSPRGPRRIGISSSLETTNIHLTGQQARPVEFRKLLFANQLSNLPKEIT